MAKYRNIKTGKLTEISDFQYDQIKKQGHYVLHVPIPRKKRKKCDTKSDTESLGHQS